MPLGARYALVLGDEEVQKCEIGLKPLRDDGEQETISFDELEARIAALFGW